MRVTSLGRVPWPRTWTTKHDLLRDHIDVAPALLPHPAGRPLTVRRMPEGVEGPGRYQTRCSGQPPWMSVAELQGAEDVVRFRVADDLASLVWIVNLGTIELHLDPGPPTGLAECCRVALPLRRALDDVGLASPTYAEAVAFARMVAAALARALPGLVVGRHGRANHVGRVLIDRRQNAPWRSTIAPYSLRAAPQPRVAAPLTWAEVGRAAASGDVAPLRIAPAEALQRLDRHGDPLAGVLTMREVLPAAAAAAT